MQENLGRRCSLRWNRPMNEIRYRIAQLDDVPAAYDFIVKLNHPDFDQNIETQMNVWNTEYRQEALEHYFKTGWSFIAEDSSRKICGFFMGQPLLFFNKNTQSLWVEYICANNMDIYTELLDISYRLSREKHFQAVLYFKNILNQKLNKSYSFQDWNRETVYLKTTK